MNIAVIACAQIPPPLSKNRREGMGVMRIKDIITQDGSN